MAEWATFVVVPEVGGHLITESRFGAVDLDLDLLAGPEVFVPFARAQADAGGRWRDDVWCEGAALVDLAARVLLVFAWEGPSTTMRLRAATLELLRLAWPGWEVRWAYDGPADLLRHLGLDPAPVRDPDREVHAGYPAEPGDEELAESDPLLTVVTIGPDRCHLVSAASRHPIAEGPALVDRLAGAYGYGSCALPVGSGLHVDPRRRTVGWWLLDSEAEAYEMARRWPGWTVEFWQDRWEEHVRAAAGRFVPPPVDRRSALDEVRADAWEHWSGPRGGVLLDLVRGITGVDPGARFGGAFLPVLPEGLADRALPVLEAAWRAAVDRGAVGVERSAVGGAGVPVE
ncbi:hypothetical protein [Kitasatospora sp. NPDC057015]|uniref:hypothetical protein n=1 Tax=Kitasatospora sp. NPDC057015 TaxID=3346001 RepID=UPI003627C852